MPPLKKPLSRQKIRQLIRDRDPIIYRNAVTLREFLDETLLGNKWHIAEGCNMTVSQLDTVLRMVRSPRFIRAFGWTVPYVKQGPGAKTWQVVDTKGQSVLIYGNGVKRHYITLQAQRLEAMVELEVKKSRTKMERATAEGALMYIRHAKEIFEHMENGIAA